MGVAAQVVIFNQTPNAGKNLRGSQNDPAKRADLKGNNPDCRLRPLNERLVLNVVKFLRQPGGWLRSSHPLKKA